MRGVRSRNQHPRLVVATFLAVAACASSADGARPDWVESRRHQQYPDGAYLIGVGTVVDRDRDAAYQQARDRAIADIAGQLETNIRSEVSSYVRESVRVEDGDAATDLLDQVSTNVKAVASASLKSIRPVEQSYDEATGLGAALVVIKRTDFAMQAQAELQEIDEKVAALDAEAGQLSNEGKLFQATQRLAAVEPLLVRWATVAAQARFVWPAQPARAPRLDLGDLFAKKRAAAAGVRLVLLCRHDAFGQRGSIAAVEQQLVRPFAALGLVVTPGSPADVEHWDDTASLRQRFGGGQGQALLLFCEVTTTRRPIDGENLIGVRSSGVARLVDANSGELLITAAYSPDAAGESPAIGSPERIDSLVDQSLSLLAKRLAPRILEQL
jgi:hypothetical protein